MLFWVSLVGAVALVLGTAGLVLSMSRAERRARRNLYRSLGLAETTVEYLMERNRDVLAELSFVRHQGEAADHEALQALASRARNVTFLRPGLRASHVAPADSGSNERSSRAADRSPSSDGHTRH
jgi:hypothetical protein